MKAVQALYFTLLSYPKQQEGEMFMPKPHSPLPTFIALEWLREGWSDFVATRFMGVFYGVIFTSLGFFLEFVYGNYWKATMGLTTSFFLMGPIICTGIYALSRQLQRGEPVSLINSCTAWRANWKSIGLFAVILTFLMIVWARVSVVVFALFASHDYPNLQNMLAQIVSTKNSDFLLVWTGVGAGFASLAFAISVVSIPLLLDRETDTMEAIFSSLVALWENLWACLVWAAFVVVLIGVSLFIFKPLLVVTAPWVGHATWKAYQSLVRENTIQTTPTRVPQQMNA
jgi:uncharacterized membrane protein